jgi:hypothetical protein
MTDQKPELVQNIPDDATDAQPIPNANPVESLDEAPPLVVGAPFAISHECDLLDAQEAAPGCVVVLRCDCGQTFKFSPLLAGPKRCPKCKAAFTHLLLVARSEDTSIVSEAMAQVLAANGYEVPDFDGGDDDDDEGDDDDDDEDEDEEGDEDDGE